MLNDCKCYACGERVIVGSYNWTYDTHRRNMWRHKWCDKPHMMTFAEYEAAKFNGVTSTPLPPPVTPIVPVTPTHKPTPKAPQQHFLDAALQTTKLLHFQAELVIDEWKINRYPFLYGAPGSGKTKMLQNFAEDLFPVTLTSPKRDYTPFLLITCDKELSRTTLLGSESPLNGKYYGSKFRKIWENGGVILFDEVGNCTGSFVNMLNSMIEQKYIDWPDGISSKMHEHCYIAFADNTNLWGNNPLYPERENLGSAFRNRLSFLEFEYDVRLEDQICAILLHDVPLFDRWLKLVRKARLICADPTSPIEVSASPRVAYAGAAKLQFALDHGRTINRALIMHILTTYLFEGLPKDAIGQAVAKIQNSPEYLAFPA